MITGRNEQYHLTKTYQDLREKGLLDIDDLTSEQQSDAELVFPDGTGRTDPDTFIIEVQSTTVKGKSYDTKYYDVRDNPIRGD
jgi:hypothetical protein